MSDAPYHKVAADMAMLPEWDSIEDLPETCPPELEGRKVYISGPMSGYEGHNYESFRAAKETLISRGYTVESPADHGYVEGWTWWQYINRDITLLQECAAICVMPHYRTSPGACMETIACRRNNYPMFKLAGPQYTGTLRSDGALDYADEEMEELLATTKASRELGQTRGEYAMVLAVITVGIIIALLFLNSGPG